MAGKQYLGVKLVSAAPLTWGEYNDFMGTPVPSGSNPESEGYLVIYKDGYKSWCPKLQFEEANRAVEGMTFGHAIEAAKQGSRIARAGWNGKGMFVVYQRGYPEGIPCNAQTAKAFGYEL
jgi:RES domain-containing protein